MRVNDNASGVSVSIRPASSYLNGKAIKLASDNRTMNVVVLLLNMNPKPGIRLRERGRAAASGIVENVCSKVVLVVC